MDSRCIWTEESQKDQILKHVEVVTWVQQRRPTLINLCYEDGQLYCSWCEELRADIQENQRLSQVSSSFPMSFRHVRGCLPISRLGRVGG